MVRRKILLLWSVVLCLWVAMFAICCRYEGEYENEVFFLCVMQLVYSLIYMAMINSTESVDILLPIHLISYIYLGLFFVAPILLISIGEEKCHGINIMDGCYAGTIIFILGYISFSIGYRFSKKYTNVNQITTNSIDLPNDVLVITATVIWLIGCISAVLFLGASGKSIAYVLSFGNQGYVNEYAEGSLGIRFLLTFSYMMAMTYIVIFNNSKSLIFKVVVGVFTISLYYVCGYRFIILIVLLGCIITTLRKRGLELSYSKAALLLVGIVGIISFIGFARVGVRNGGTYSNQDFSWEDIVYSLKSNFDIYQPYYGLVSKYPSKYSFTYGRSMIVDTVSMWVPRIIWPNKPTGAEQTMTIAVMNSVNAFAIKGAAMSWPNIAEFYMEFGIAGVCIFMYMFGRLAAASVKWYHSSDYKDTLKYAIMMPAFLQLVIRGYTPSNVTMLVYLFIPLMGFDVVKSLHQREK